MAICKCSVSCSHLSGTAPSQGLYFQPLLQNTNFSFWLFKSVDDGFDMRWRLHRDCWKWILCQDFARYESHRSQRSEVNSCSKTWLAKVAMATKAHGCAAFICFHPTKPCSTGWLRGIRLSTIRQLEQFTITGRGVTPVLQRVPSFNTLKGCAAHIFWLCWAILLR